MSLLLKMCKCNKNNQEKVGIANAKKKSKSDQILKKIENKWMNETNN